MGKVHRDRSLRRVSWRQDGVFLHEDAIASGFSSRTIRRRVDTGAWQRARRGAYASGTKRLSWEQRVQAAVLAAGPDAAAGGRTAARLWQLEAIHTEKIEIIVPSARVVRLQDVTAYRRPPFDVVTVRGIRRTTPPQTIIHLAGLVGPLELEIALDDALRRRMFSPRTLLCRLEILGTQGRTGAGTLRALLLDRTRNPTAGSRFEIRLVRILIAGGEPVPSRQFTIRRADGTFVARVDLAYPAERLALEYESFRYHSSPRALRAAVRRENGIGEAGWVLRKFTDADLDAPSATVKTVRTARLQGVV
jgi:hypothetical protein